MKFGKIIAVLLALMMLAGSVPVLGASTPATKGSASEDEIAFLTAMGFMSNDNEDDFGSERKFGRGEFATMLCNLLKFVPAELAEDASVCVDVTGKNEYAPYIKTIIENGYMTVDSTGRFWSGETVTFEEVSYAMVVLAGGRILLNHMPAVNAAVGLKLYATSDVLSGGMTKGQVASILYETLHSEYYKQVIYGADEKYVKDSEYLVLEAVCGLVYGRGIVEGANRSTFTRADNNLVQGQILIDGKYYYGEESEKYFGYMVDYYYPASEEKANVRNLSFIQPSKERNECLEINSENIADVSGGVIRYYTDKNSNKTKTVTVSGDTDVIYNSVALPAWTDEDLNPDCGTLLLLDNNSDGDYDVVFVSDYEFYVVGNFNNTEQKLYDRYTGEILDLSREGLWYDARKADGDTVTLARGMRPDMMVAVRESREIGGVVNVFIDVVGYAITGTISAIRDNTLTIGETTAEISKGVTGEITKKDITLGKKINAYLWNGRIVRMENPDKETAYPNVGYLVNVALEDEAFSNKLIFRWCNARTTLENLEGADKIIVDGVLRKDMNDVLTDLNEAAKKSNYDAAYPYAQPIQLFKDAEGRVNRIDTNVFNPDKEDYAQTLNTPGVKQAQLSAYNYSLYDNSDGSLFCTTTAADTTYYLIPSTRDDEDWYVKGARISGMQNAEVGMIEPYFVQDNLVAGVIFRYYTPSISISSIADAMIIKDIAQVMDDEGEIVTEFTYYNMSGNVSSVKVDNDCPNVAKVKVGDMIRWTTDYKDKVINIEIFFSPGTVPANRASSFYNNGTVTLSKQCGWAKIYGTVVDIKDGIMTLTTTVASDEGGVNPKEDIDNFTLSGSTCCFRFDASARGDKVTNISQSQLLPYLTSKNEASEVFVYVAGSSTRVIYEIVSGD